MNYSDQDHDRALARLNADLQRQRQQPQPAPVGGLIFGAVILLVCLAVLILMTGCNTIGGIGADLNAAAKGTQAYLADDVETAD